MSNLVDLLATYRWRLDRFFAQLARRRVYARILLAVHFGGLLIALWLALSLLRFSPAPLGPEDVTVGLFVLVLGASMSAALPGRRLTSQRDGLIALAWAAALTSHVMIGRFVSGTFGAETTFALLAFGITPLVCLAIMPRVALFWAGLSISGLALEVFLVAAAPSFSVVLLIGMTLSGVAAMTVLALQRRESRERTLLMAAFRGVHPAASPETMGARMLDELVRLPGVNTAFLLYRDRAGRLTPIVMAGEPLDGLVAARALDPVWATELFAMAVAGQPWVGVWRLPPGDDVSIPLSGEAPIGAFAPLLLEGEAIGLLALVTSRQGGDAAERRLSNYLPLLGDFASVAAAAIAPSLLATDRVASDRAGIREIIAAGAFRIVFQPVVRLADRVIVGYEALTRFDDGVRPDRRFELAAELGLSVELEAATISAALEASVGLPSSAWLAINVTPSLLSQGDLLVKLLGTSAREIVLEVTEAEPITDHVAVENTRRLLGSRVRLAIDDAGVRYAGLDRILQLKPDFVKLDISLVRDIDSDQPRRALARALVSFAIETSPPLTLIAEGIETIGEANELHRLSIGLGQGYLLGIPADVSAFFVPLADPE